MSSIFNATRQMARGLGSSGYPSRLATNHNHVRGIGSIVKESRSAAGTRAQKNDQRLEEAVSADSTGSRLFGDEKISPEMRRFRLGGFVVFGMLMFLGHPLFILDNPVMRMYRAKKIYDEDFEYSRGKSMNEIHDDIARRHKTPHLKWQVLKYWKAAEPHRSPREADGAVLIRPDEFLAKKDIHQVPHWQDTKTQTEKTGKLS